MSNSNVNTSKSTAVVVSGSYIVTDAPASYNPDGTIKTPVKYHAKAYPQNGLKVETYTEQRSSSVTPGFSGPNRPAILPPLSFSYKKWQLKQSFGQTHFTRPGTATLAPVDDNYIDQPNSQIPNDGYAATTAEIDSADRTAVIDLLNKIKGMSFNAAQALAERQSTARTIGDAASKIAKAIVAVRKGDVAGAARALGVAKPRRALKNAHKRASKAQSSGLESNVADFASSQWLALSYGWKPLLNDVYGAAEQLAKSNNNVQFQRVRHRKSIRRSKNTSRNLLSSGSTGMDVRITRINETVDISYGVTFSQSSSNVVSLKQLGITNPALVAWELVPFSFVADWFMPVGNFISSLDATLGLDFKSGYKTVFRRIHGEEVWDTNTYSKSDEKTLYRYIYNSWERIECTRTPLAGFPAARTPPFKNPVSVTHAANAIALLHQLFKR